MKAIRLVALAIAGALAFAASGASAQATRTWVSGVGDDVNPCSRTAPCKTFAGAISKTAAGGEINCLDPGGFGAVTITKSMTISCPYTEGGALAGGNGITVNDSLSGTPNTAVVYLRGLDIFGVNPPSNGVRFISGAALHIEDSVIRRFNAANSQGVSFQPAGGAELFIRNTTIAENGNGATGGGILIKPTGNFGTARVVLSGVRVKNNANFAVFVDTNGNTSAQGVTVVIHDSSISGNEAGVRADTAAGTNPVSVMITDSVVANNNGSGLITRGPSTVMRVGNTTITGNDRGLNVGGGTTLASYGDNRNISNPIVGAANDGAFTAVIPKQ